MAVFTQVPQAEAAALVERLGLGELVSLEAAPRASRTPTTSATRSAAATCSRCRAADRRAAALLPAPDAATSPSAAFRCPSRTPTPRARSCTDCAASPPRWSTACAAATGWRPTPRTAPPVGAMLARMHAGRRRLSAPPAQPARPGLVGRDRAAGRAVPRPRPARADRGRAGVPAAARRLEGVRRAAARADPRRLVPRQRDVRGDAEATACRASSTSISPASTRCSTTSPCASTTGASTSNRPSRRGSRAAAFVAAYESVRPLSGAERRLLPAMMRGAALRFWISRLWDLHLPRDASVLTAHDPAHFERVLRERLRSPWHPWPPGQRRRRTRREAAPGFRCPRRRLGAPGFRRIRAPAAGVRRAVHELPLPRRGARPWCHWSARCCCSPRCRWSRSASCSRRSARAAGAASEPGGVHRAAARRPPHVARPAQLGLLYAVGTTLVMS